MEECKLCGQDSTPWHYIHGHICQDCYYRDRWISVKDELPGDEYVLCYQSRPSNPIQVGFRSSHSGYWFPNLYEVTHWMPLPEPPK